MSIKTITLKSLIEVLGGLAVILSLLFVGWEIRQNTNAIAAQAIFGLNDSASPHIIAVATNGELARIVADGNQDPEDLSDLDAQRYEKWLQATMNTHEAAWTFHNRGIISDMEFAGWQASACSILAFKGARQVWVSGRLKFIEEFQNDVNQWCEIQM